eukprot:CAMPEP_0196773886 /NCGR_PEP_ID=MMETSP1104-20130614/3045_1 /TAXON_ID=33652 /ORGANISM="Cafeteria sp., Strain Caron Lab Isolate" /LENGTH=593 /DNA_ID=CAMNT_0042144037 /DNA_START=14 /DNA_END=1793 /DNA_ORIENTATION=-
MSVPGATRGPSGAPVRVGSDEMLKQMFHELKRLRQVSEDRGEYIKLLESYTRDLESEVRVLCRGFVESRCAPRKRRRLAPIPSVSPLHARSVLSQPGPDAPQLLDALGGMCKSEAMATLCDTLAAALAADHQPSAARVAHALDVVLRAEAARLSACLVRSLLAIAVCGPVQGAAAAASAEQEDPVALAWAAFAGALGALWRKSAGPRVVRVVLMEFLCHGLPRLGRLRVGGAVGQRAAIRATLCACALATLAAPRVLYAEPVDAGRLSPLQVVVESCSAAIARDRARASSSLLRALLGAAGARNGEALEPVDRQWRDTVLGGLARGVDAPDPACGVISAVSALRCSLATVGSCSSAIGTTRALLTGRAQPGRAQPCTQDGCAACRAAHTLLCAAQAVKMSAAALGWDWAHHVVIRHSLERLLPSRGSECDETALLYAIGAILSAQAPRPVTKSAPEAVTALQRAAAAAEQGVADGLGEPPAPATVAGAMLDLLTTWGRGGASVPAVSRRLISCEVNIVQRDASIEVCALGKHESNRPCCRWCIQVEALLLVRVLQVEAVVLLERFGRPITTRHDVNLLANEATLESKPHLADD